LDSIGDSFLEAAANPANILALGSASCAYQFVKWASLEGAAALGASRFLPQAALKIASSSIAFAGEVSVFRGVSQGLAFLKEEPLCQNPVDCGGWWGTAIDLASLKIFSPWSAAPSIWGQFVQSNAMVWGRSLAASLGLAVAEEGSYVERMSRAQALGLASMAGQSLFHGASQGVVRTWEKRLEVVASARTERAFSHFPSLQAGPLLPDMSAPAPLEGQRLRRVEDPGPLRIAINRELRRIYRKNLYSNLIALSSHSLEAMRHFCARKGYAHLAQYLGALETRAPHVDFADIHPVRYGMLHQALRRYVLRGEYALAQKAYGLSRLEADEELGPIYRSIPSYEAFAFEVRDVEKVDEFLDLLQRMPKVGKKDAAKAEQLRKALQPVNLLSPKWARLVEGMEGDFFGLPSKARALHAALLRPRVLAWAERHLHVYPPQWEQRLREGTSGQAQLQELSLLVREALLFGPAGKAEFLWERMRPGIQKRALQLLFWEDASQEVHGLRCSASQAQAFSNLLGRHGSPLEVGLSVPPAFYGREGLRVERTLGPYGGAIYSYDPAARKMRVYYGNRDAPFRPASREDRSARLWAAVLEIARRDDQSHYLDKMRAWCRKKRIEFEAYEVPYAWIHERAAVQVPEEGGYFPPLSRVQAGFEETLIRLKSLPPEVLLVLGDENSVTMAEVSGQVWPIVEHNHPPYSRPGTWRDYSWGLPSIQSKAGGDLLLIHRGK